MGVFWFCILVASSIFSYVYISKHVYSDKLLQDDSNRIMVKQYIEIYSLLDDIIKGKKDELENKMTGYITSLTNIDGKIEISEEDEEDLANIINSIKLYKEAGIIAPGNITSILNSIQVGNYSENDIQSLNALLDSEIKNRKDQIDDTIREIEEKNQQIIEKEERLKTYSNTISDEFKDVNKDLQELQKQRDELKVFLRKLRDYVAELENCKIKIDYIENGLERKLYNETLELRKYLNQDTIDTDALIETVENVYNDLFTYNISSSDPRIIKYNDFKNYVNQYVLLVEKKEIISNDREKMYAIISENESIDEEDDKKENEEIDYGWEEISSDLQNILKDIPQEYFDEFILKSTNENQEYFSKNEIIELIMNMDRLYLSDLNDFERAWTLLRNDIHTYKTLLWFSVIFAFGMDLFSFGTGVLLYFMDNENKMDTDHKQSCWKKIVRFIRKH